MAEKKLEIDFASAVSQFEKAIKKLQIRKIIYKSVFRGKGLEFEGYRYFEQDDDSAMIDWKASLRANKLLAKKYIEERDLNVYFAVDVSNGMLFGSQNKLKAEYAAEIIAALSHLILGSGDNAGIIMFSDNAVKFLKPSKDRNQFYMITKFLSEPELYGSNSDLTKELDFLLKVVKSPFSIVILISDFINLRKGFERELKLLSTKFETIALMIRDPMDNALPKNFSQMVIQDPRSGKQMVIDPAVASEKYAEISLKQKKMIMERFKDSNVDLLELNTEKSFVIPVISFLKSRAKSAGRT